MILRALLVLCFSGAFLQFHAVLVLLPIGLIMLPEIVIVQRNIISPAVNALHLNVVQADPHIVVQPEGNCFSGHLYLREPLPCFARTALINEFPAWGHTSLQDPQRTF